MIKVNLLSQSVTTGGGTSVTAMSGGSDEVEVQEISPEVRNQALSKVLMIFAPVVAMYFYAEFYNLPNLKSRLNLLTTQIAELEQFNEKNQALTDEITKIKQDQDNIQARIKTIHQISGRRFDEIKLIEALQQMIVERVYLVNLRYRQGRVTINGFGETVKDVIDFQEQLQKSAILRDVVLVQQSDEKLNEQTVKQFEINFRLEDNL